MADFTRENTYKCSPLVTKWQIILHFHCCFDNKYTPYFLGYSIFSVNIISLPQEVRGIFVIKAAVEMQNNLPFCDQWRALVCIFPGKISHFIENGGI
jgi:hypothetical protein